MVEYQNWYQVLRPIGSFIKERSRVEILSLANESDLRLRDKVRSMPFGFNKRLSTDEVVQETFVPSSSFDKSESTSYEEMIFSRNLKKRGDSETYLSPKLKAFQDQEKEIKTIFWNLLKTVDPECSGDIDVEAIREFLERRQEQLGRKDREDSDVDVFDKYELGMHARKLGGTGDEEQSRRAHGLGIDSLVAMVDKMVEERTKPIPQVKDMYDKNDPITGKVGFRRDEINGPREYTDLDEQLDFGDVDKDVDFKPFLVEKGRGRFDSKGNYIPIESEVDKRKGIEKNGMDEHKKGRRKRGRRGSGNKGTDSTDDVSRVSRKGKSKRDQPRTASELHGYLDDLKKSRRYPEWDFPMCNYPKWVHRMYRMDQQRIGQLIKQGMDVPEYCPPWMVEVLDSVWRAKDAKTRGEKPSNLEGRKVKGLKSGLGTAAGKRKDTETGEGILGDKRESQKDKEQRTSGEDNLEMGGELPHPTTFLQDRRAELGGAIGERESKASFGIGDFLGGYEKEILDLAKLEADSDFLPKHRPDDAFDIDDLIADYENQLQREEVLQTGVEEKKKKRQMEEKTRETKARQEAAKKKIEERDKKLKQDEKIRVENEQETLERKKEQLDKKLSGRTSTTGTGMFSKFRGGRRKSRKFRSSVVTEPCSEYKTWPSDPAKDEECMKRFRVLLQGRNKIMKENEFSKTAEQISLFEYKKATPPKTPCERVKLPIC
uniref:Uncharacterized protein n=1 Tax=Lygus hesperus TaxID=30085 RepID=A0A0A9XT00_LYGHE